MEAKIGNKGKKVRKMQGLSKKPRARFGERKEGSEQLPRGQG